MDCRVDLAKLGFKAGERVTLADDDWTLSGDIILVDVEPVPGSTQCLVQAGGETLTVSLGDLRHI